MNWVGIVVSGEKVILVHAEVGASNEPISVLADQVFKLPTGAKADAYAVISEQVQKYVQDNHIEKVIIKASATSKSTALSHLHAAELRGVVMTAAAKGEAEVITLAKAVISRTFGKRKADEYLKDQDFWDDQLISGNLKVGSREAALLILAQRDKQ